MWVWMWVIGGWGEGVTSPGLHLRNILYGVIMVHVHSLLNNVVKALVLTYMFSPLSILSLFPYITALQVLKESLALMFLQVRV